MSLAASTFRWLQLKRYQYEVTFSLYMLTPTEKFIFSKQSPDHYFLFNRVYTLNTTRSISGVMIIIAATLYLPQHLAFLTNRAWFYYNGPSPETVKATAATTTFEDILLPIATTVTAAVEEMKKATSTQVISLVDHATVRPAHKSILETVKEL